VPYLSSCSNGIQRKAGQANLQWLDPHAEIANIYGEDSDLAVFCRKIIGQACGQWLANVDDLAADGYPDDGFFDYNLDSAGAIKAVFLNLALQCFLDRTCECI